MNFDINAKIVPGESLGGVKLYTPIVDLQHLLPYGTPSVIVSLFEARYSVADGCMELAVDIRNGKIFKIIAQPGYRGLLFNKIRVGMSVKKAMKLEPRLYYDEDEELLQIKGNNGVTLDVPEIDPFVEEVPNMNISAISVIIPELITNSSVQQGRW